MQSSIIRLPEKVPEVYVNESRDFQLFLRLYECLVNGVRFSIDDILSITNTRDINSSLLNLLQGKLGFFTDKKYSDDNIRIALEGFPYIVKGKGSHKAIEQAVMLWLRANNKLTTAHIDIINKEKQDNGAIVDKYEIIIYVESTVIDVSLLQEIFRYILPPCYKITYIFYRGFKTEFLQLFKFLQKVSVIIASNYEGASIRYLDSADWPELGNVLMNDIDVSGIYINEDGFGIVENGQDENQESPRGALYIGNVEDNNIGNIDTEQFIKTTIFNTASNIENNITE